MTLVRLVALPLLTAALTLGTASMAAPIMVDGGTYTFRILPSGGDPAPSAITGITFDGNAESFSLSDFGGPPNVRVTIDESQTELGGGLHEVVVGLTATGDLFPVAGQTGFVNIGFGGDPLDLARDARLVSAFLSMWAGTDFIGEADFVAVFPGLFSSLDPWDGYFLTDGVHGGFGNVGGRGIDRIGLRFILEENGVPLPGTLALSAAALLLLAGVRRRA